MGVTWKSYSYVLEINSQLEPCDPNRCGIRLDVNLHHLQTAKAGDASISGTAMYFFTRFLIPSEKIISYTNSSNVVALFHLWTGMKSTFSQSPYLI